MQLQLQHARRGDARRGVSAVVVSSATLTVALLRISKRDNVRELAHSNLETVNAEHTCSEI